MTTDATHPAGTASLKQRLEGLNLYLVGMMGAGKSAVGRPLAEALGYRFIDADEAVEQVAGQSIAALFAEAGEAGFRELETAVLGQIAGWHSLVVATGGGVVTRPENWGHMQQGVVIWLDADEPLLLQRLSADPTPRPLLAGSDGPARLRQLLEARRPLYSQADLRIEQGQESAAVVAAKVLTALPSILKNRQDTPPAAVALQNADGEQISSLN